MAAKITRRITATEVKYAWFEIQEGGVAVPHNDVHFFPGKVSAAQAAKALNKTMPEGQSVTILGLESSEKYYQMPIDTFIRHATVVDKAEAEASEAQEDAAADADDDTAAEIVPQVNSAANAGGLTSSAPAPGTPALDGADGEEDPFDM